MMPGDRIDQVLGGAVLVGLALLVGLRVVPESTPGPSSAPVQARPVAMTMQPVESSPATPVTPNRTQHPPEGGRAPAAEVGEQRAGALAPASRMTDDGPAADAVSEGDDGTIGSGASDPSITVRAADLSHANLVRTVDELARSSQRWPGARSAFTTRTAEVALAEAGGRIVAASAADVRQRYELVGGLDARALRLPRDRNGRHLVVPITDVPGELRAFVRDRWPRDYGQFVIAWEAPQQQSARATATIAVVVRASGYSPESIEAVAGEWKLVADGFAFVPSAVDHRRLGRRPVEIRGGI